MSKEEPVPGRRDLTAAELAAAEASAMYESPEAKEAALKAQAEAAGKEIEAEAESAVDPDAEFPQHTGGGWYELSDGSKVQGQEAAEEAEAKL